MPANSGRSGRPGRRGRLILAAGILALAAVLAPPAVHLLRAAWDDKPTIVATPAGKADDASRLNATEVREVWRATGAEAELVELVARARADGTRVSIAGARHSMGGHTLARDGIVIDMLPMRAMSLSEDGEILRVQAGALWTDVVKFLDTRGRSVAVMQSDSSFSVGGSLSVNVHGWQVRHAPIATTVEAMRVLLADGTIVRCSRSENPELFSLVLGGYGLFGIILEAELRTVPNEWYEAEHFFMPAAGFADAFREHVDGDAAVQMAYGRMSVASDDFLQNAALTVFRRSSNDDPLGPQKHSRFEPLARAVFRGTIGSDYGKHLRWNLEKVFGEKLYGTHATRNELLSGDVALYVSRSEARTDVLHEYFLPPEQLAAFFEVARTTIRRHGLELLNVTLRDVREDRDTFLSYATRDFIAAVMFFDQPRTMQAEKRMAAMTVELVDASLRLGGRYYLPYRPHPTLDQFHRAYPRAAAFAEAKRRYDPRLLFRNQFYERYLAD